MKKTYRIKSKFRFTVFMTIAAICILSITGILAGNNTAESLTKMTYSEIQIQPGDTLWNLAEDFGPDDQDIRKVVYSICEYNHISADSLKPGQTIYIPTYI